MNNETIIQRNAAILFTKLDDEYLALDAEAGFCYSLNLVSGHIWNMLEQPTALGSLCTQLRHDYRVDQETCQRDVADLLTKLAQAGLVTLRAA
jgi:hypothetical protein